MITYETCKITEEAIQDAINICVQHDDLRGGICYSSLRKVVTLYESVKDIRSNLPSWYIEKILRHRSGFIVHFSNGSTLDVFVENENCRGKRFHYLMVDEDVSFEMRNNVLIHLIRDYDFLKGNDIEYPSLFSFAESILQNPLNDWQKDMLIGLAKGETYIVGSNLGRQEILNIYKEWKESPVDDCVSNCVVCEYTYDEIMAGIKPSASKIK